MPTTGPVPQLTNAPARWSAGRKISPGKVVAKVLKKILRPVTCYEVNRWNSAHRLISRESIPNYMLWAIRVDKWSQVDAFVNPNAPDTLTVHKRHLFLYKDVGKAVGGCTRVPFSHLNSICILYISQQVL